MDHFLKAFTATLIGFFSLTAFAGNGHIQVKDSWIRAVPPTVKVMAAYMTIANAGEKERKLTGISSSVFTRIEIHQYVMENDMARMERQTELAIPSHGTVALKPGGLHLMLMGAKKPLHAGDFVPLTVVFRDGEEISVTAIVRSGQMQNMEDMEHSQNMD